MSFIFLTSCTDLVDYKGSVISRDVGDVTEIEIYLQHECISPELQTQTRYFKLLPLFYSFVTQILCHHFPSQHFHSCHSLTKIYNYVISDNIQGQFKLSVLLLNYFHTLTKREPILFTMDLFFQIFCIRGHLSLAAEYLRNIHMLFMGFNLGCYGDRRSEVYLTLSRISCARHLIVLVFNS